MSLKRTEPPDGYLDTSDDQTWKPCMMCKGELLQVRKALWTCLKCGQEYIACEEDMRPDDYELMKRVRVK